MLQFIWYTTLVIAIPLIAVVAATGRFEENRMSYMPEPEPEPTPEPEPIQVEESDDFAEMSEEDKQEAEYVAYQELQRVLDMKERRYAGVVKRRDERRQTVKAKYRPKRKVH